MDMFDAAIYRVTFLHFYFYSHFFASKHPYERLISFINLCKLHHTWHRSLPFHILVLPRTIKHIKRPTSFAFSALSTTYNCKPQPLTMFLYAACTVHCYHPQLRRRRRSRSITLLHSTEIQKFQFR